MGDDLAPGSDPLEALVIGLAFDDAFYVLSYAPINRWYREREMHGSLRHRSNTMKIIRLSAMAALGFALLTGNALAQTLTPSPPSTGVSPGLPPLQSQIQSPLPPTGTTIIQPIPLTPPQLPPSASASLTCSSGCDTLAMNCQNSCVSATSAAANPATVPATGSCNLSCATQQLVCKQSCGPGQ